MSGEGASFYRRAVRLKDGTIYLVCGSAEGFRVNGKDHDPDDSRRDDFGNSFAHLLLREIGDRLELEPWNYERRSQAVTQGEKYPPLRNMERRYKVARFVIDVARIPLVETARHRALRQEQFEAVAVEIPLEEDYSYQREEVKD